MILQSPTTESFLSWIDRVTTDDATRRAYISYACDPQAWVTGSSVFGSKLGTKTVSWRVGLHRNESPSIRQTYPWLYVSDHRQPAVGILCVRPDGTPRIGKYDPINNNRPNPNAFLRNPPQTNFVDDELRGTGFYGWEGCIGMAVFTNGQIEIQTDHYTDDDKFMFFYGPPTPSDVCIRLDCISGDVTCTRVLDNNTHSYTHTIPNVHDEIFRLCVAGGTHKDSFSLQECTVEFL
jgi:hypothetical protein